MDSLCVLFVLLGAASLSCRLFTSLGTDGKMSDVRLGAWIILFFFVLYSEFMLLGFVGLYKPLPLFIVSFLFIIIGGACLVNAAKQITCSLMESPLSWQARLCLTLLLPGILLSIPGVIGHCDITYHLPNAMYFVRSGDTASFDPRYLLLGPDAPTNYFTRGHDLILSVIFFSRYPKVFLILLKALELALFICASLALVRNQKTGWLIAAFVMSTDIVSTDVNSLKNDLFIAALVLFVMAVLLTEQKYQLWPYVAFAAALAVASKSNSLLYLAPFVAVYMFGLLRRPGYLAVFALILFCGCLFYVFNFVHTGNPIYPFSVSFGLLGAESKASPALNSGSILQNFDVLTVPLFLRGMARAMSPVHVFIYFALIITLSIDAISKLSRRTFHATDLAGMAITIYTLFIYTVTPFSDNNGVCHNMLFSGNNLRLNLVFWCLLPCMVFRGHAALAGWDDRLKALLAIGAVAGVLSNSLLVIILKPELAFPALSPTFMTNNAWTLFVVFLIATILCWFVLQRRRWLLYLSEIVFACVIVTVFLPDDKFAYSETLRRMPSATRLFERLGSNWPGGRAHITLVAPGLHSNVLLGSIVEYACTRFKQVRLADAWQTRQISLTQDGSCTIACANVETTIASVLKGRAYQLSFDYLNADKNTYNGNLSYQDQLYRLFIYPKRTP